MMRMIVGIGLIAVGLPLSCLGCWYWAVAGRFWRGLCAQLLMLVSVVSGLHLLVPFW